MFPPLTLLFIEPIAKLAFDPKALLAEREVYQTPQVYPKIHRGWLVYFAAGEVGFGAEWSFVMGSLASPIIKHLASWSEF
jgi:hypothetical protein